MARRAKYETCAWWSPKDIKDNPAVRKEVQGTDWSIFSKALRKTSAAPCECGHPQTEHSKNRGTCTKCWDNFMDHFQDFYKGTGPEVDYCKRFKGDRTKTAAEGDKYKDIMGDEHEEVHGFTGRVRGGHLENPMDHTMDWHHGSPSIFKTPGEHEDDEEDRDEEYEPPERHWNTHLGTHWTSLPEVAKKFAGGLYDQKRSAKEVRAEPGSISTAHLGITNPKVYKSEFDMDKEAHEYGKKHFGEPYEDEGDDDEEKKPETIYGDSDHASWISSHPDAENIARGFKARLQTQGHDGIVYGNEVEGPHHRDFTGVKPGSNPPMRGHPCAITFDPSQHHNVRSRGANEPDREQLHLFDKFGHIRWAARGARDGDVHPGGGKLRDTGGHKTVQWVPIHEVKKYALQPTIDEKVGPLKDQVRQNGMDPLVMHYNHEDKSALLMEGNHRLRAAEELGWSHVPVRVQRGYPNYAPVEHPAAPKKARSDQLDLAPSQIGLSGTASMEHKAGPYQGGHKFVFAPSTHRSMNGVPYHQVTAWEPGTEHHAGDPAYEKPYYDEKRPEGSQVGLIRWMHTNGNVQSIEVHPDHRRQGLGTELWDRANQVAKDTRGVVAPKHSKERTNEGEAWARSVSPRLPKRTHGSRVLDHFGHVFLAMSDRSDYGMGHSPTEGPPLHNLLGGEGEAAFAPKDIYTRMHDYSNHNEPADSESIEAIQNARHDGPYGRGLTQRGPKDNSHLRGIVSKPDDFPDQPAETDEAFAARKERRSNGEHHVTVYRAAPKGVKTINHGDWVSLSKTYARGEGRVSYDKTKDQPVYKARVKAKHVRWAGDSLNEFGYFGPEAKTEVHFRGGKNAERADQPHEGAMRVALAAEEIIVPRNIDTMRDSTCAVCGSQGTMNGDRCTVCNYLATPEAFQSPDLGLAGQVRDQLGIGNPDGEGPPEGGPGAPQGLDGDPNAMGMAGADQEAAGEPGEAPDLICDNCGATFDSSGEEEDLSEPYLSPAARIEPDVSALGVPDDVDVAREVAGQENMTGQNEGVGYQAGGECPTCGEGTLVPNEGGDEGGLGPEDDDMAGAEGAPGELGPGNDTDMAQGEDGTPEGDYEGPPGEGLPPGEGPPPDVDEDGEGGEPGPPVEEGQAQEEDPEQEGDEDDEGDDEPPFIRRQPKESSTMAQPQGAPRRQAPPARPAQGRPAQAAPVRRQVAAAAANPAALERQRLFQALTVTTAALNRQADLLERQDKAIRGLIAGVNRSNLKVAELGVRSEGVERQMALVANASGLMEPLARIGAAAQSKVAALYRRANPANPAQPVPEPGSEPSIQTSEEARQSAGRDDVTQLGATPISDVSADATTSVDTPYGELANQPVGMTRVDVTAPVAGTEVATPPEMTVIPVDTRIGNPNNPQVAFPFTIGPVGSPAQPYSGPSVGNPPSTAARQPQRPQGRSAPRQEPGVAVHPGAQVNADAQSHYIASVNLARLRGLVGITTEEPFELGIKIAGSMSDAQINAEAQGLQAVASRLSGQAAQQPPPFQPGAMFPPVTAAAQFQPPYVPEGRVMVPHMASSNGGGVLPTDPSFQAGKYGPGPGSAIASTTMFAPRSEEMGWDSPV